MIRAAQYARENRVPYLGICYGMQMAVIEAARHLAGLPGAGSEEINAESGAKEINAESGAKEINAESGAKEINAESGAKQFLPVVYHLKEWVQGVGDGARVVARKPGDDKGGTLRLGAYAAKLAAGSLAAAVYGATAIEERHRHRYEEDVKYRAKLEAAGLRFSGMSPDDRLPEIVEVVGHPWFIGVQFHPELKSRPFAPHPLFAGFIGAAVKK